MDKKEFATFAMAIKTYYPRENLIPNEQAMNLWFIQLQDLDYKTAELVLNKWVATNKWSPSIAEIRAGAAEITQERILDWGEAWEKVLKAVWHFGSYEPEKAMESLDELTRAAVKRIGYHEICMSQNIAVERANFRDTYNLLLERQKERQQIAPQILAMIETAQKENIKALEEKSAAADQEEKT